MRSLPLSLLGLLFVACGPVSKDPLPFPAASADGGSAPDPTKFGPFQVGVRTVTYADSARKKSTDGGVRELITEIWYPAPQSVKGQPGVSYDIKSVFTPEQQQRLAALGIPILTTPAVRDAPMASEHGPFPVVIFSHGHGGLRWQSTYYTVLLASHGYVVLSPDHEEDTLAEGVRGVLAGTTEGIEKRPVDILFLLAVLERLKSDDFLFGHVDLSRIGMSGHSFGALTSLRVAAMDPKKRLKVIVPQAPTSTDIAWLGLPMPVKLGIPVMIQGARLDDTLEWDANIVPAWAALEKPRWLLDITRGGHFTFSDLCAFDLANAAAQANIMVPGANIQKVLNDGCGPMAPRAEVAQPLMNHYAVALFNGVLRGNKASMDLLKPGAADAFAAGAYAFTADP